MVKIKEDPFKEIDQVLAHGKKSNKATSANLPEGCNDGSKWRNNYIPTCIVEAASANDPFVRHDNVSVQSYQMIFNTIYGGKVKHKIQVGDAVFKLVRIP
jgi:hypothetical protein